MSYCFMDITIGNVVAGRVLFELFENECPKTCENFRALCTGSKGKDPVTRSRLHYRNITFHRVVPNFLVQAGDVTHFNGSGGVSIYGGRFLDESFKYLHERGSLSMANSGPNSNGSQFFICLVKASWLDKKHVVFGKVVQGMQVVDAIGQTNRKRGDLPEFPIVITTCGVMSKEECETLRKGKEGTALEDQYVQQCNS